MTYVFDTPHIGPLIGQVSDPYRRDRLSPVRIVHQVVHKPKPETPHISPRQQCKHLRARLDELDVEMTRLLSVEPGQMDMDALERQVKAITDTSHDLRVASLEAMTPAPVYYPVGSGLDRAEPRSYGGVKASRLVSVTHAIAKVKATSRRMGVKRTRVLDRVKALPVKLLTALKLYVRVKQILHRLERAVDYPERAMTVRPQSRHQRDMYARRREPNEHTTPSYWDVSPHAYYGWRFATMRRGYDPRQTSLYWLERKAARIRQTIYRDHHGIEQSSGSVSGEDYPYARTYKVFTPPQGAEEFDQIWPPIDLQALVDMRRREQDCHSGADAVRTHPRRRRLRTKKVERDEYLSRHEAESLIETEHPPHTKHQTVSAFRVRSAPRNDRSCKTIAEDADDGTRPPTTAHSRPLFGTNNMSGTPSPAGDSKSEAEQMKKAGADIDMSYQNSGHRHPAPSDPSGHLPRNTGEEREDEAHDIPSSSPACGGFGGDGVSQFSLQWRENNRKRPRQWQGRTPASVGMSGPLEGGRDGVTKDSKQSKRVKLHPD